MPLVQETFTGWDDATTIRSHNCKDEKEARLKVKELVTAFIHRKNLPPDIKTVTITNDGRLCYSTEKKKTDE